MNKNINTKNGFTLIELLVTISLIAILSGIILGITDVGGLRKKSRDAQRIGDLKKIQTALELYFADNRVYPTKAFVSVSELEAILKPTYLNTFPSDPQEFTGAASFPCAVGSTFGYTYYSDGSQYYLITHMEVPTSATPSPCTGLTGWSGKTGNDASCTAANACYGVQNPL